jgi:hypothetical protein
MSQAYISGFTIVRNARKYDYPVVESITSILPICDEFVVCVGASEDDTLDLVRSIGSPKLRIIETVWDDRLREGGRVLAIETDKAFDAISPQADWGFYLQADEVVHEQYLPAIRQAAEQYRAQPEVEGLLFGYTHFYGSYDYVGDSRRWYRHEVRMVRHDPRVRSYRDAQGFRRNGQKLKVKLIDAQVYHYGWVKDPHYQQAKQKDFHKLWHSDEWVQKHVAPGDLYDYANIDSVVRFAGTHPAVMRARVGAANWEVQFDESQRKFRPKDWLLYRWEKLTGWRPFEYKNYQKI